MVNNNGFLIRLMDLLALRLQFQPIITANNQWLSKISSIPNWTTECLLSTVTKDERRITAHSRMN
jgi:hypothetical protein